MVYRSDNSGVLCGMTVALVLYSFLGLSTLGLYLRDAWPSILGERQMAHVFSR